MEKTVILIKPDGIAKNLTGEVLRRFQEEGFRLCAIKMIPLEPELLREHYAHICELPFFPEIVEFMTSRPVVAMALEGENIVERVRELVGPTDSTQAAKGTIRGDFGEDKMRNIVHASDTPENGLIELERFFAAAEVF